MKKDLSSAFQVIGKAFSLWWADWVNQVLVCLVGIILSLTIFLAPASLFGIFQEIQDLTKGNRTGIIGFWKGFKNYFKHALIWGFFNLIIILVFVVNFWFYSQIKTAWAPVILIFLIILVLFWFMMQFLSIGYYFEQKDKSLKLAWKNSILTILGAPWFSLIVGFISLIISILSLTTFLPLIIGTPALLAAISLLSIQNRLEVYQVSH